MNWLTGARQNWALAVAAALLSFSCSADRGAAVFVPPPSAPAPEAVLEKPAPPSPPPQTTVYNPPPAPEPRRQRPAAPDGTYHVRSGDTLGKIAQRFGTTVSRLQAWNGLSGTQINVGQSLRVPSVGGAAESGTRAGAVRQACD